MSEYKRSHSPSGRDADLSQQLEINPEQLRGWLLKWTNYIKGYQNRWFVLSNGLLSYYRTQEERAHTCRGTINLAGAFIDSIDATKFVITSSPTQVYHLRALNEVERQRWVTALELAKSKAIKNLESDDSDVDPEGCPFPFPQPGVDNPLLSLNEKLQELKTAHDLVTKNSHSLLNHLGDAEADSKLKEKITLLKLTTSDMVKTTEEFMLEAKNTDRWWSQSLQHKHSLWLQRQDNMEALASQLHGMESDDKFYYAPEESPEDLTQAQILMGQSSKKRTQAKIRRCFRPHGEGVPENDQEQVDPVLTKGKEQKSKKSTTLISTGVQEPKKQLQGGSSPPAGLLKEILLTPSIEPLDLPKNLPEFLDPVDVICCNASGGVYFNTIHGITLRIPEGAVPHGMELEISIGVCLYGNFSFPEGLAPISALVWLCTQNRSDFKFLKPVELIVPHFLDCQSTEDTKSHEMCFLKASHQPTAAEEFQFCPTEGLMDFTSLASRGILFTQHFCYDCIVAKISDDQLKNKKFCVTCAVPRPITSWSTMYFYVTYHIPTCIDNLQQLIHGEGLYIDEKRRFHFSGQSGVPRGLRGKKHVWCSPTVNPVTVTLQPKMIKMEELDYWQLEKDGCLEFLMKTKQYPPNMRLKIGALSPTEEQIITVTFEGTQESEEDMAIELTIPSSSNGSLHTQHTYQVQATVEPKPVLQDMPTIRQLTLLKSPTPIRILQKLALHWETLGYTIDFDPQGDHVQLVRKEQEREGPLSCCRRILIDWQNGRGSYQPANWGNLIEILEDMNEIHLARRLRELFSLHQPRNTSHAAALETLC